MIPEFTANPTPLQVGDTHVFDGIFKRRTIWQWLTRRPRELQQFVVVATGTAAVSEPVWSAGERVDTATD